MIWNRFQAESAGEELTVEANQHSVVLAALLTVAKASIIVRWPRSRSSRAPRSTRRVASQSRDIRILGSKCGERFVAVDGDITLDNLDLGGRSILLWITRLGEGSEHRVIITDIEVSGRAAAEV